jgi:large subunit ribosomal protein L14
MVQPESKVIITDNSGGKIGKVFKILGASKKRYARIGERLVLSVQKAEPRKQVKKKDVLHAVVVRQAQPFRRKDGSYIKFDENSVVIINKENGEPVANRIFGPVPRELAEMGYQKIVSMAPEVI